MDVGKGLDPGLGGTKWGFHGAEQDRIARESQSLVPTVRL